MTKYFKEEKEKIKLSEYLKKKKIKETYILNEEKYQEPRTKYIMEIIGDVELEEEIYKLFLHEFDCWGGRYDVRTKRETIKGIYEISQKYPFLSALGLEKIWYTYIHDLFETHSLDEALGKYIELYGKTDEAFLKYIEYVETIAKEYDKQFEEEASKLDIYSKDYELDLIQHLKYIIKSKHIQADKIIDSIPSRELIAKDRAQLIDISARTRIFFGVCSPISYQMIESLARDEGLERYPEQPQYLINGATTIDATFTKEEFLESIQKEKQKTRKLKK